MGKACWNRRSESLSVGGRKAGPSVGSQEEMLDVKVSLGALPRSCYEGLPAGCYGNRPVAITVLGSVPVTGSRYGQPFRG